MVLDYDPHSSFLRTAARWNFTVWPHVLGRLEFWCFILLHIVIVQLYGHGYLKEAHVENSSISLDWNDLKVLSGITVFFEVFFTQHTYSRYMDIYTKTRALLKLVCEFCFEASLHLNSSRTHVYLASRYFLCSVVLFFLDIRDVDDNQDQMMIDRRWRELQSRKLIWEEEKKVLARYRPRERPFVMLHWAAKVIRLGQSVSDDDVPNNAMRSLIEKLIQTYALQQEVGDVIRLPIPFQYFHLLNLMIVLNLVLWAYAIGITASVLAGFTYFVATLTFMGMMELCKVLSNPFGDDDTDFPLNKWVSHVIEDAIVLLDAQHFGQKDKFQELARRETQLPNQRDSFEAALVRMMNPSTLDSSRSSLVSDTMSLDSVDSEESFY